MECLDLPGPRSTTESPLMHPKFVVRPDAYPDCSEVHSMPARVDRSRSVAGAESRTRRGNSYLFRRIEEALGSNNSGKLSRADHSRSKQLQQWQKLGSLLVAWRL